MKRMLFCMILGIWNSCLWRTKGFCGNCGGEVVLQGVKSARLFIIFWECGLSYASTTADCGAEQTCVTQSYTEELKATTIAIK